MNFSIIITSNNICLQTIKIFYNLMKNDYKYIPQEKITKNIKVLF